MGAESDINALLPRAHAHCTKSLSLPVVISIGPILEVKKKEATYLESASAERWLRLCRDKHMQLLAISESACVHTILSACPPQGGELPGLRGPVPAGGGVGAFSLLGADT